MGHLSLLLEMGFYYIRLNLSKYIPFVSPFPKIIFLEITRKCNLKCKMCEIWRQKVNPEKELTKQQIFSLIKNAKDLGIRVLNIDGGEAFLRPDIFDIIKQIKKAGMKSYINSNGTLCSEEFIEKIINSGLDSITFSLDGKDAKTHDFIRGVPGTFDRVTKLIKKLTSTKKAPKIAVLITISKHNIDQVKDIINLCIDMNVESIRIAPVHRAYPFDTKSENAYDNQILGQEDISKLIKIIKYLKLISRKNKVYIDSEPFLNGIIKYLIGKIPKHTCFANTAYIQITSNGDIKPCLFENPIGNIKKQSLKKILNSKDSKKYSKLIQKRHCKKCWLSCYQESNIKLNCKYFVYNLKSLLRDLKHF